MRCSCSNRRRMLLVHKSRHVGVRVYRKAETCKLHKRAKFSFMKLPRLARKKTGRIRGVRGQLKLIACSGSVHFQQHQGSNALNTRTRPSRWHRMLQQQHQTATTHLLTCSSPPYRHCSSGVLRPGSKLHPQSPSGTQCPIANTQSTATATSTSTSYIHSHPGRVAHLRQTALQL